MLTTNSSLRQGDIHKATPLPNRHMIKHKAHHESIAYSTVASLTLMIKHNHHHVHILSHTLS